MEQKLSERIKELRKERGLTIVQLAKELGYSKTSVGHWETGERQPSLQALVTIAQYFGVTTDYLLGLED